MIKSRIKYLLFLVISLFGISVLSFAQCTTTLSLSATPTGKICKGDVINFTTNAQNEGNTPQYYWYINNQLIDSGTAFSSNFYASTNVQVVLIASSDTCFPDTIIKAYQVQVTEMQATPLTKILTCHQDEGDVKITDITGGTSPYTLALDGTSIGSSRDLGYLSVGSYQLIITDKKGCQDTNTVVVTKETCNEPEPTKEFSPNGDGYLDTWYIKNIEDYPDNKVYIFDRWGQRVFYKKGYTNADGWDGTYLGTNAPTSAYYYVLYTGTQDNNGKKIILKGSITLIR